MLDFDLYAIKTTYNEYNTDIDELFTTYQEAYDSRMKYANWYRPNGDVDIVRLDSHLRTKEEWHIDEDGSVRGYYSEEIINE